MRKLRPNEHYVQGASWPLGSPASPRHPLQPELTEVWAPLRPWQPAGVCCECDLCACHVMCPAAHHRLQIAPSLCPTGSALGLCSPMGPGRLKMLQSSSYLISVLWEDPWEKTSSLGTSCEECLPGKGSSSASRGSHSKPHGSLLWIGWVFFFSLRGSLELRLRWWGSGLVLAIRTTWPWPLSA